MKLASHVALGLLLLALTACGGGSTVPPPALANLVFVTQPASGDFQNSLQVTLQFEDENGNLYPTTLPVGINVVPHAANPVVSGTQQVDAVGGIATFDDLWLDATGTFQLVARGGHPTTYEVVSQPFTYQGPPKKLAISHIPDGNVGPGFPPVQVSVQDKNGNPVTVQEFFVTLRVTTNPSRLLMLASGMAGQPISTYIYVDPLGGVVPTAFFDQQPGPFRGMTYDAQDEWVYGTDAFDLYIVDPLTGQTVLRGPHDPGLLGMFPTALTIDQIGMIGGDVVTQDLYDIDPVSGNIFNTFQVNGGSLAITGWNALATHPMTGENWGWVRFENSGFNRQTRWLISFDPITLSATVHWGWINLAFSGLSFYPDGTMYAVTGDGSPINPRTIYEIDPVAGSASPLWILPTVEGGETMTTVPGLVLGTLQKGTTGGVVSFDDVLFEAPGAGFKFTATALGVQAAASNTFDIDP